ncbi:PEGA domain-containing protein [Sandaracinus amylolyticus]|uniref:PEGA domain-containing protein n=1 Tax=Sandaracinus amylolyticus TaxID=927083 RepID=UPI001F23F1D6|nr:PEGA domain-containing protein [Sandaracinus amylolyticus]UJR81110.1 PEGA domain-containing protein [Sandaracinus amylolyticus]
MRAWWILCVLLTACAPPADASEGTLIVRAHERGVVHVDARPVSGYRVRLARGMHVVELRRGALVIASERVEVRGGSTVEIDLDVIAAGSIASDAAVSGRVEIRSVPPGAEIEIDGAPAGLGALVIDLVPGPHVVRVWAPGYEAFEQEIYVGAGAETELDVQLVPSP